MGSPSVLSHENQSVESRMKVSGTTFGIPDDLGDRYLCLLMGDPLVSQSRPDFNITNFHLDNLVPLLTNLSLMFLLCEK